MPQKSLPKCVQCENGYSPMWRNTENGQICQTCYELDKSNTIKTEAEALDQSENSNNGTTGSVVDEKKLRKSTRTTRYKNRVTAASAASTAIGAAGPPAAKPLPKGRNRRNIFKKMPVKTPVVTSTTTVVDSLFYNVSTITVYLYCSAGHDPQ